MIIDIVRFDEFSELTESHVPFGKKIKDTVKSRGLLWKMRFDN